MEKVKIDYLSELGFEDKNINIINEEIPNEALKALINKKDIVITNIKYLKDLGINNYQDAFMRFYNMFLIDNEAFDEIFSKYDQDDLVAKLEKNIAIMEHL